MSSKKKDTETEKKLGTTVTKAEKTNSQRLFRPNIHAAVEADPYLNWLRTLPAEQQSIVRNMVSSNAAANAASNRHYKPNSPWNMDSEAMKKNYLAGLGKIEEERNAGTYDTLEVLYDPNRAHLVSSDYLDKNLADVTKLLENEKLRINQDPNPWADYFAYAMDGQYAAEPKKVDVNKMLGGDLEKYQSQFDFLTKEKENRNSMSEYRNIVDPLMEGMAEGSLTYTPVNGEYFYDYLRSSSGINWNSGANGRFETASFIYDYIMNPGYSNLYDALRSNNDIGGPRYKERGLGLLDDQQKSELMAAWTQGEETFMRALGALEASGELTRRYAELEKARQETMAEDTVLGAPMFLNTVFAQFANGLLVPAQAVYGFFGNTDPNSYLYSTNRLVSNVRTTQAEGLGKLLPWQIPFIEQPLGEFIYNGIAAGADMGLAFAAGSVIGNPGLVTQWIMSSEAASNTLYESYTQDMDPAEATARALLSGAIEAVTEKYSIDALLKNPSNVLAFIGKNALTGGAEEGAATLLNTATDALISILAGHEDKLETQYNMLINQGMDPGKASKQVLTDYLRGLAGDVLLGAFSEGILGTPTAVSTSSAQKKTGFQIANSGNVGKIIDLGMTMAEGSESKAISKNLQKLTAENKRVSNRQIGQLYQALHSELDAESSMVVDDTMLDAIAGRLVELGEDPETARKAADGILKVVREEKPTAKQRRALAQSSNSNKVIQELMFVDGNDVGATVTTSDDQGSAAAQEQMFADGKDADTTAPISETQGYAVAQELMTMGSRWVKDAMQKASDAMSDISGKIQQVAAMTKGKEETDATIQSAKEKAEKMLSKVSTDKKSMYATTVSNKRGEIQKVTREGKEIKVDVKMEDGSTERVSLAELQLESRPVAEIVAYVDENSEVMSDDKANLLINTYTGGDASAHIADFNAAYNAGFSGNETPTVERMDPQLAQNIAQQGKKDAEAAEAQRIRTVGAIALGRKGSVTFTENMADTGSEKALKAVAGRLSDVQKKSVAAIKQLARATGVNFVFFESQADSEGRYTAENGHYDVKTGTIYLDLNSGKNSTTDLTEYAILRTAGHELTHFIEHSSKEGYAALREFVTTELIRRGENFDELVAKKMDNAARSGAPLTRAGAISEVVADASELMLRDTKAIERLAQKDQGLLAKIKGFIQSFVQKVRDAFSGVDAVHEEARVMMQELAEEFQQKWDIALEEAVETAQAGVRENAELRVEVTENANDSVKQYAIRDSNGNDITLRQDELDENKRLVSIMHPVVAVSGNLFKTGYPDNAIAYFEKEGNIAVNPILGNVVIEETGLNHLIDFLSARKTALIPAIKSVISNGSIVHYEATHKNNPWGTAIIAAKVTYDGDDYYMGVSVRHLAKNDTRYYIHDAIIVNAKKSITPNKNAGDKAYTAQSGSPSIYSILLQIRNYNTQNAEAQNSPHSDALTIASQIEFTGDERQSSLRSMTEDYNTYRQMLLSHGSTREEVDALFEVIDAVMADVEENKAILDFGWDVGRDQRSFNPVKPNSDSLYEVSVDFSTLCRKRLLQQVVQERLEREYDTVLTKAERVAIRNELMRLREQGKQIEVACALCYVESARLKSPAQIQRFFDDRRAVMVDYFAKKNKAFMADVNRQAEDLIESYGYDRKTPKKELKTYQKRAVENLKQGLYKKYKPSAEEEAAIATAMELPGDSFKTDKGLWKLKQEHETIFDAYTSYVRNATKAKGIEGDEAWWAGDSESISDKLIEKMNAENGLRSQSWSDFQVIHLLDYMAAIIELSTRGAKMQTYTKVPDFVNLMGDTGAMINLSLIPSGFSGKLEYDPIEGMPIETALKLRDLFPNTAGTICIGITDKHIRMLLADPNTDYVIPYHSSSLDKKTRQQMGMKVWDDFQSYQTEKQRDYANTVKDNGTYHKSPRFSDWYDYDTVSARAAVVGAEQAMREAAQRYIDLCHRRGLQEKFAQFASEPNYWKLLIDRKMINQKTGEIIKQEAVKPRFDLDRIRQILKSEVERFNAQNKDAKDAADYIAQMWEKGDIRKAAKSKQVKDAVKAFDDTVIVRNIVESAQDMNTQQSSLRDMPSDLTREYMANLTADDAINDVEKDAIRVYTREVRFLRQAQEKLDQVIAERDAQPEAKQAMYTERVNELRRMITKHYDQLTKLEATKGVAPLMERSRAFVQEFVQGKTEAQVEKLILSTEREVERLNNLIKAGNSDLVKERNRRVQELKQLRSKATEKLLAEQERYRKMIATDREIRTMTQKASKLQSQIAAKVKALDHLRRHETDYKNVPEAFKPAVDTLVGMFADNFGSMVFTGDKAKALSEIYGKLRTEDGSTDLAAYKPYYDPDVEEMLKELAELAEKDAQMRTTSGKGTTRKDMAQDRLVMNEDIKQVVDHIAKIVTDAQNLFYGGRKAQFDAIGTQIGNELNTHADAKTLRGKAGNALTTLDNLIRTGNMTPVYFFKHLGNEVLDTLWNDIRHGQNEFGLSLNDSKEFIEAMQEQYHYWDWTNKKNDLLEITTEKGRKLTFTREQALWLYATWKRETSNEVASTEHLTKGGIIYEGNTQEGKGLVTTVRSTPAVLSEGDIQRVVGWLTDAQKAYADGMVAYLSEDMADRGNRASMAMFGIRKYTEKYYFPYKVASSQLYQTSDAGKTSTTDDSRLKHSSFTNRLTKKASAPLVVGDFSTIVADHIARMTTYSSFVLPIESMNRVLNYKVKMEDGSRATVRSLIEQKYGEPAKRYIATLLSDLNGGVRSDNRVSGADYLVRMFKKGAVSASLSTALQQPTSIFRAMAMINPKYIAAATFSKRDWDELMKYSGVAVIKDMGRFDTDMGRSTVDWLNSKKLTRFMDKVDYISGWLPGKMDQMTWAHLWNAVKLEQAAKNPNMNQQSEDFLTLCAERFNDIVDHTQVYDSILSRSQLMRGKDAMSKMVTSFKAEPTLTINMLYDAAAGLNKPGGKAKAAKVMAAVLTSNIAAAAMAALIQAWDDDDDERTAATKYLDKFLENAVDNNNPLSMPPVVSDVWSMFQGYDVQRADMSLIGEMYKAIQRFQSDSYSPYRKVEELVGTTAKFFGLSLKNLMRDGRRAYNLFTSSFESPSSYELSTALPWADDKMKAHYDALYSAMDSGNSDQEKGIREYLAQVKDKSGESVDEGVRNVLKERVLDGSKTDSEARAWLKDHLNYDNRKAFETVDKWQEAAEHEGEDGWTYSIYNDFYEAVESGKNLKQEIKQLLDLGIEATTIAGRITTEFKPLLLDLLASGKTSQAAALQAKILDAYVALGYNRDQKLRDVKKWYTETK